MPGLLHWMDLDDILMLCAPRPVLACTAHASAVSDARDLLEAAGYAAGDIEDLLNRGIIHCQESEPTDD